MTDDAQSLFGNCAKKMLMFFFVDLLAPIALDTVVVVVLVLVGCSCCSCFLIVLLCCCSCCLVVFSSYMCEALLQGLSVYPDPSKSVHIRFFLMVAARVACSGQFALQSVEPTRN